MEQDSVNKPQHRSHFRRCFVLTSKHSLKIISSCFLPLVLAIFTVVITLVQKKDAGLQRLEDRELAREQRQQDLNISVMTREQDRDIARQQRENDEKKREQDLRIANDKRKADDVNAEKQRIMLHEIEEMRFKQEQHRYFDELLVSYMNDIGILLEKNNGSLTSNPVVAALSRAKTLQIVPIIGHTRTARLVCFLYDAGQLIRYKNPLDLSGADFRNVDFSLWSFPQISLAGTRLHNASFAGKDMSEADFHNANLTGIDFRGTRLIKTDFRSTDLTAANFSRATCVNVTFERAIMNNIVFSYAVLSSINFTHTQLNGANFNRAYCRDLLFENGSMVQSDFSYTNLSSVVLFRHVNLTQATFYAANILYFLSRLSFIKSTMNYADFRETLFSRSQYLDCYIIGADFSRSHLENARFESCDLDTATFVHANLDSAIIAKSSLAFTMIANARLSYIKFPQSDLSYANLSDVCCDPFCKTICGKDCQWPDILSMENMVLCNETTYNRGQSIGKIHVHCNRSLKDYWEKVSYYEPMITPLDTNSCILTPSSKFSDSYVSTSIGVHGFEWFFETHHTIAIRTRMSAGIKISSLLHSYGEYQAADLQFLPTNSGFLRSKLKVTLAEPRTMELTIKFHADSNYLSLWFQYIEIAIAPPLPRF